MGAACLWVDLLLVLVLEAAAWVGLGGGWVLHQDCRTLELEDEVG